MCLNCTDPLVEFARENNFNLVKIPRSDILPLDILLLDSNSKLQQYCQLPDMVFQNINVDGGSILPGLPKIKKAVSADFSGKQSGKVNVSVGLDFLSKILNMLGAKSADFGLVMNSVKELQFEFSDVKIEKVDQRSLSKYMSKAVPDISVDFVRMNDEGEAFIITEVLKSNSIDMKAFDESGLALDLNVGAIKDIVGPNVKVDQKRTQNFQTSFKGNIDLTFAFRASVFWIEAPQWSRFPRFKLGSKPPLVHVFYAFEPNIELEDQLTEALFPEAFSDINKLDKVSNASALQEHAKWILDFLGSEQALKV